MPIKSFLSRRSGRRGGFYRRGKSPLTARVVIRKPVSWGRRLLWGGLALVAAVLAGAGLFIAGQYSAGYASVGSALELRALNEENGQLQDRIAELSDTFASTTTQLHIEQGARKTMEGQMLKLEEERNRLSRDLALFDNLFPSGGDGLPTIRGFRIEPVGTAGSPGAWRYRLLIMRAGKNQGGFAGDVQVQVRYRLDGHDILARTPESGNISEHVEFDRYQRVEGHFQAPNGAKLLGAIARVVENGRPVAESVYQP